MASMRGTEGHDRVRTPPAIDGSRSGMFGISEPEIGMPTKLLWGVGSSAISC